jgi:acyl-[acyl-carrier-protein]-UDP-N-acetylglucosamine O-acyltransferase
MISPLAYVDPGAKIGKNVTIAPFAYVEKGVEIGDDCTIMPYASVLQGTIMGRGNKVYHGAILGAIPQDFRFKGEDTLLKIGDDNTIREKVTINRATTPDGCTSIGNGSFLMEGVHVSHDTRIGNDCIIGTGSSIAGECRVDDKAILSSRVILHQGCHVGTLAMVKGGSRATKDVPPYIIAAHNPISYYGVNAVILSKCGFSPDVIDDIAKAYRQVYQCNISLENALSRIRTEVPAGPEIQTVIDFLVHSTRGIIALQEL